MLYSSLNEIFKHLKKQQHNTDGVPVVSPKQLATTPCTGSQQISIVESQAATTSVGIVSGKSSLSKSLESMPLAIGLVEVIICGV